MHNIATLTCIVTVIAMASFMPAMARADDGGAENTVILGGAVTPEYEGADTYRFVPLLNGTVYAGNRYFDIEGVTASVNLVNRPGIEFGPIANLTFGRDNDIDSPAVATLGDIDDAIEAGLFAAVTLPLGDASGLRLAIEALRDISGTHDGWLGSAGLAYLAARGRWQFSAEAAVSIAGDRYAATYFSVTAAGAALSGLPQYAASGGIKDAGMTLIASYALSDRWSVNASAAYHRLLGDFADSPVVAREGSANQLGAGLGVGIAF